MYTKIYLIIVNLGKAFEFFLFSYQRRKKDVYFMDVIKVQLVWTF